MTDSRPFLSRSVRSLVFIGALPLVLIPLVECLSVSPFGSEIFLWLKVLFMIPVMAALLALFVSPFLLFFRQFRLAAFRAVITSGVVIGSIVVGLGLGNDVRMSAFHRLAERSTPLIQAIRAYEARHSAPPATLADLVPGFMTSMPQTGMGAYPNYEYYTGTEAEYYEHNPWVLLVHTPIGFLNWDQFMYFPRQNYPPHGYGGFIERVADWAYVHE